MNQIQKAAPAAQDRRRRLLRILAALSVALLLSALFCWRAQAASINIDLNPGSEGEGGLGALQMLFLLTLLALAPSLLVMMTSFTRIVIVFSLLRNALGTAQTPPNQVLVGLALFLSMFIMWPTLTQVNDEGIQPYLNGEITQDEAIPKMEQPIKIFMLKQIKADDLNLFLSLSGADEIGELNPEKLTGLGLHIIVPAFMTSELKRAFIIGFLLFLPFLVIDMIVASTLMSMGMVMLPPTTIALPFKLMLFVVVNGWGLVIETLVVGFHT